MKKVFWAVGFLGLLACLYVVTGAETKTTQMWVLAAVPDEVAVVSSSLNFGTLSPDVGTNGSALIQVRAPIGTIFHIALDAGQNFNGSYRTLMVLGGGTDAIGYLLYKDPGTSEQWGDAGYGNTYAQGTPMGPFTGTGVPQQYQVYGQAFMYSVKAPGNYQDSVAVTVNY